MGTMNFLSSETLPADPTSSLHAVTKQYSDHTGVFKGYCTSQPQPANSTWTPIPLDTVQADTNNWHSTTTTSRVIPTIAGWYHCIGWAFTEATWSTNTFMVGISLSGNRVIGGTLAGSPLYVSRCVTSGVVHCNGTTDYVETAVWQNSGATQTLALVSQNNVNNSGGLGLFLIRAD